MTKNKFYVFSHLEIKTYPMKTNTKKRKRQMYYQPFLPTYKSDIPFLW